MLQLVDSVVTICYMENYLKEKRREFVYALIDQGYTSAQLARLFNTNRTTIKRIVDSKPKDYKAKWVKVD